MNMFSSALMVSFLGQELNPEVQWHRRLRGLELNGLRFLTVNDLHGHAPHHRSLEAHGVSVELQSLHLIFWYAVAHTLDVLQVAQHVVYFLLRRLNVAHAAFKLCTHD